MPWCPNCRCEYVEGVAVCDDCGAALVEELRDDGFFPGPDGPAWPNDEHGHPVTAAKLFYAMNPMDVALRQSLLHAYGIPTLVQSPNTSTFSTVLFGGQILGAHLLVPETLLEKAEEVLAASPEGNGE